MLDVCKDSARKLGALASHNLYPHVQTRLPGKEDGLLPVGMGLVLLVIFKGF